MLSLYAEYRFGPNMFGLKLIILLRDVMVWQDQSGYNFSEEHQYLIILIVLLLLLWYYILLF